jgi:predicted phosphohydrolase
MAMKTPPARHPAMCHPPARHPAMPSEMKASAASRLQTASRRPQTATGRLQTANRKPQTANRRLQTADCDLQIYGKAWGDLAIFAISDLHLSLSEQKPMDVFGSAWERHFEKIAEGWLSAVGAGDTVLMPGDFCWATYLDGAAAEFAFLHALPGRKILSKGNHDYWWSTVSKMNQFMASRGFDTVSFLQNDAALLEAAQGAAGIAAKAAVAAAKGWLCPGTPDFAPEDAKLFERERGRLRNSLQKARSLLGNAQGPGALIAMTHYPPFAKTGCSSDFLDIISEYRPSLCIYGHLHGTHAQNAFEGRIGDTELRIVSADFLNFRPLRLL